MTKEEAQIFLQLLDIYRDLSIRLVKADSERWEYLKKARKHLDKREYAILKDRFLNHLTLEELGTKMGVTRERIRQIDEKALNKILKIAESV